ncbi:MAG: AraC family transcriptional regulator ligand-binding domain-containing protein [Pseudomonadota bacterium]
MLASIASSTVAFALSQGIALRKIETVTGIRGIELMDPDARLPDITLPRLWQTIGAAYPDRALPLEMARAAPFSVTGGLAHGAQFAADLRTALELMVENRMMIADRLELELVETGPTALFRSRHPLEPLDSGRGVEFGIAMAWRLVSEVLEVPEALVGVDLAHPPNSASALYEEHFGAPVRFDQPHSGVVLARGALDEPVAQASAALFAYVTEHFLHVRRRLAARGGPPALAPLVRAVADSAAQGEYGAAAVAARAGMSLRAAQRLARAHNTTLGAMIDVARAETARELLADPKIDVATAAYMMGYSDDRAFRRAVKRWTGQAPSALRQRPPEAD